SGGRSLRLHGYEIDTELNAFVESKFKDVESIERVLALVPQSRLASLDDSCIGDLQAYTLEELSSWMQGIAEEV
ncbi:hypothetical protein DB800_24045, partial [Xanthomonas perforans]